MRTVQYRVSCNCGRNPTCQSFVCDPQFDKLHYDIFTDSLNSPRSGKQPLYRAIRSTETETEKLAQPLGAATFNRSALVALYVKKGILKKVMLIQCQCNCETSHSAGDFTSACYCYQSADSHGRCDLRRWSCAKQTVKYTHGGKQFHQSFICYSAVNPLQPCTGVKWLHFIVFMAILV